MKTRILSALLAALAVAGAATASVSAAAKVADRKANTTAYIADITVDGKAEDAWKYAPEFKVAKVNAKDAAWYKDTMKPGTDYADVSGKVLWDGKNTLYVLATIVDKTPCDMSKTYTQQYFKDGVELFIEEVNDTKRTNSPNPFQRRFTYDGVQTNKAKTTKGVEITDKFAMTKTATGWVAEFACDITGAADYIAFDMFYNDNVQGKDARDICLGWCDDSNSAYKDSSKLGQVELSAKKVADMIAADKAAADKAAADKAAAAKAAAAPKTADTGVVVAAVAVSALAAAYVLRKKNER